MHRINHKFKEMLKIMEMLKTMNNNFSLIFENEESRAIPVANDKEELFFCCRHAEHFLCWHSTRPCFIWQRKILCFFGAGRDPAAQLP